MDRPHSQSKCDVLVVGGGPAGIAAACAAAKGGSHVVLAEAWDRLGGTVTAALHRCLCGLYDRAVEDPRHTLNDGIQRAIVERMVQFDPETTKLWQFGKCCVLEFSLAAWHRAAADLCIESGVDVRLGTSVTAARRDDRQLTAVRLDDREWLTPKVAIDCTGQGRLLGQLGNDTVLPEDIEERRVLGGFCIGLANLGDDIEMLRLQIPLSMSRAVESGLFPVHARFTMFHPGPQPGTGVCKFAVSPEGDDAQSIDLQVVQILEHLRRDVPAFADARELARSPRPLWRSSPRLRGRVVVCRSDVLDPPPHHADADALGWWPIERWGLETGPTYEYPPPGRACHIPPQALRSAGMDNILAAGACVSASEDAACSLRAAGVCLATGDAAGRLAQFLAVDASSR